MFTLLGSLLRLLVSPANLRDIARENLALRQQLAVFKRKSPRPRPRKADRFFWVWLSKSWKDWHRALVIVRPETVVAWHRQGFRQFGQARERETPNQRSALRSRGRGHCLFITASCCRRATFSKANSLRRTGKTRRR